jgi:predicted DNA-binding protein with PD1-like motif
MKVVTHVGATEVVAIGLGPGELLLESVEKAIKEHDIRNGVVVSGIGTLKTCHMHYITHTNIPSDNAFFTLEEPLELLSVSGIIADGEPHLHAVVSHADKEARGGHVEPGCEVAYLAELVIQKFNDLRLKRHLDTETGLKLLGPED